MIGTPDTTVTNNRGEKMRTKDCYPIQLSHTISNVEKRALNYLLRDFLAEFRASELSVEHNLLSEIRSEVSATAVICYMGVELSINRWNGIPLTRAKHIWID